MPALCQPSFIPFSPSNFLTSRKTQISHSSFTSIKRAAVRRAARRTIRQTPTCQVPTYDNILDSVLKLYCIHRDPDYSLPWAITSQKHTTSSAFVTADRRILTNAHSVEHHVSVRVKKRFEDRKYKAVVVAVGNECDIALLKIVEEEEEQFWGGYEKPTYHGMKGGVLPALQDAVLVIGYPSPGEMISVTKGVSSRVEMLNYVHGQGELLAVQIDAAINPGNSGGPVINDQNQVVGIAFQSVDPSQADSVGYFIPYCIVQHFLDDIAVNKRYTGFPFAGFRWQRMENSHLRHALGLQKQQTGILVKWVSETSDAARVLQRGDIVTHIDGISVSNAGTVPFRSSERIGLEFMVTSKFNNDSITIDFLRLSEKQSHSYHLSSMEDHRLVPVHDARHNERRQPEYVIFGGLVFQALSEPFLSTVFGSGWIQEAPIRLVDEYYRGTRTKQGRSEVVILAQVLATNCTMGYEDEFSTVCILKTINGQAVNNLRHLAKMIDTSAETNIRFEFDGDAVIIINGSEAQLEEAQILSTHCVPQSRSLQPNIQATPVTQTR